jgi:RNA polymerase sigma factor (sigma-70 family)
MHEEALVVRARGGDRGALEELIRGSKDLVYNLAVRMLGDPAEAEDVSQEILIRVVTGLASFRGESSFRTWVYRVASNHLLTARKRRSEERMESFDQMAEKLEANLAADEPPLEDKLLVHEAKLVCTSMMLLCLDRDHRLTYILGEIFELSAEDGAAVLEISEEAFRKRLSRARTRMAEFVQANCGLHDPKHRCRCGKQAAAAMKHGYLDPQHLRFATHPVHSLRESENQRVEALGEIDRALVVLRGHPSYAAPASLVSGLRELIEKNTSGIFD